MVGKQAEKVEGLMVFRVALRALECRVRSCCARGPGVIAGASLGAAVGSDGGCEEGCDCGPLGSCAVVSVFDAGAAIAISVSF